jgi:hypothetical protein
MTALLVYACQDSEVEDYSGLFESFQATGHLFQVVLNKPSWYEANTNPFEVLCKYIHNILQSILLVQRHPHTLVP